MLLFDDDLTHYTNALEETYNSAKEYNNAKFKHLSNKSIEHAKNTFTLTAY